LEVDENKHGRRQQKVECGRPKTKQKTFDDTLVRDCALQGFLKPQSESGTPRAAEGAAH
jgi:hypothetical protein